MKSIVDFFEESYNAGDTLCDLITSKQVKPNHWDEGVGILFCYLDAIDNGYGSKLTIALSQYRHKAEINGLCNFRDETARKVYDYLIAEYENYQRETLQAQIDLAQAKLDELNKK